MNIIELRVRKKQLEIDISGVVSTLVEEFKKDTGVSPISINTHMLFDSINTDMLFADSMGFIPEYIVGETSVNIDI